MRVVYGQGVDRFFAKLLISLSFSSSPAWAFGFECWLPKATHGTMAEKSAVFVSSQDQGYTEVGATSVLFQGEEIEEVMLLDPVIQVIEADDETKNRDLVSGFCALSRR